MNIIIKEKKGKYLHLFDIDDNVMDKILSSIKNEQYYQKICINENKGQYIYLLNKNGKVYLGFKGGTRIRITKRWWIVLHDGKRAHRFSSYYCHNMEISESLWNKAQEVFYEKEDDKNITEEEYYFKVAYYAHSRRYSVYAHILKENNAIQYIGQTENIKDRWRNNGRRYAGQYFYNEGIQKYGWDAFEHVVLEDGLTKTEALQAESKYIVERRTFAPYGFNIALGEFAQVCIYCKNDNSLIKMGLDKAAEIMEINRPKLVGLIGSSQFEFELNNLSFIIYYDKDTI